MESILAYNPPGLRSLARADLSELSVILDEVILQEVGRDHLLPDSLRKLYLLWVYFCKKPHFLCPGGRDSSEPVENIFSFRKSVKANIFSCSLVFLKLWLFIE